MEITPTEKKILERFFIIASSEPIYSISPNLINRIVSQTGATYHNIQSILEQLPAGITALPIHRKLS